MNRPITVELLKQQKWRPFFVGCRSMNVESKSSRKSMFTYMLCEINLDRANFVIPLLFKLSNILAILQRKHFDTDNQRKRQKFNWKTKINWKTQQKVGSNQSRDGADFQFWRTFSWLFEMKKKMAGFFTWKTTEQPDGARWQMSLEMTFQRFVALKKDKGTRDWRVSLRLRPWADWQVTSRRRQSPSRSGGGARESHSSARWPISGFSKRFFFKALDFI